MRVGVSKKENERCKDVQISSSRPHQPTTVFPTKDFSRTSHPHPTETHIGFSAFHPGWSPNAQPHPRGCTERGWTRRRPFLDSTEEVKRAVLSAIAPMASVEQVRRLGPNVVRRRWKRRRTRPSGPVRRTRVRRSVRSSPWRFPRPAGRRRIEEAGRCFRRRWGDVETREGWNGGLDVVLGLPTSGNMWKTVSTFGSKTLAAWRFF